MRPDGYPAHALHMGRAQLGQNFSDAVWLLHEEQQILSASPLRSLRFPASIPPPRVSVCTVASTSI